MHTSKSMNNLVFFKKIIRIMGVVYPDDIEFKQMLERVNLNRRSALHIAAANGALNIVKFCLAKGHLHLSWRQKLDLRIRNTIIVPAFRGIACEKDVEQRNVGALVCRIKDQEVRKGLHCNIFWFYHKTICFFRNIAYNRNILSRRYIQSDGILARLRWFTNLNLVTKKIDDITGINRNLI